MSTKHNTSSSPDTHELSFEKAFQRLEEILEKLNSSTLSLEDALKFYEEADALIIQCNKKLTTAEKKVEMLMKNRSGELQMQNNGAEQKPVTQDLQL